jgi:hypothetical protein
MSPINASVIGSTHCIIKPILSSRENDVEQRSDEIAKSLDGEIK